MSFRGNNSRNRKRYGGIGGSVTQQTNGSLSDILTSCLYQIDATLIGSYPGTGQAWKNIITAPVDGTSQSGYDFQLGTNSSPSTDDPTFTGTAGDKGAYFLCDGGDWSSLVTQSTFMQNLYRTDQTTEWWAAMALNIASAAATATVWGNSNGGNVPGCRVEISAAGGTPLRFISANGTTNVTAVFQTNPPVAADFLLVLDFKNGAGANSSGQVKTAVNSRTFAASVDIPAFTNTNTSNGRIGFGAANNASAKLPDGSKLYGLSMGQGALTNTQVSQIVDYYNTLHGRTYA